MRFPTALDRTVHHILGVTVGSDYHRGTVELLWLVQRRAFRNKEAEAAVRFAAYPEQGDLLTGFAAEIHDRADFAVGVYAYPGTGILAGQVAGCHAAVPEGDGAFLLVHRDRIAKEARLAGELAADRQRHASRIPCRAG